MNLKRLTLDEVKQIPIVEYLSRSGFEPAYIRGADYWYHSPPRGERTPSFKVNTQKNVWFDHGSGEGGTLIDLGMKLHRCSLSEFLNLINKDNHNHFSFHPPEPVIRGKENKIEVLNVSEISNPKLIHYLNRRGIDLNLAKTYCKEVEFKIGQGIYRAIGFPNVAGAFDLRNHWFKGSTTPKGISLITNNSDRIAVTEGFMDFLSLQKLDQPIIKSIIKDSDFLVLNSLRLIARSIPILKAKPEVNLFLDNDLAAGNAKAVLMENGIPFNDRSKIYLHHKDVNEYLVMTRKDRETQDLHQTKTRGRRQ
ncbi:MAG: toprim domain-containing protein [Cyclobacteriaceae bacterium]